MDTLAQPHRTALTGSLVPPGIFSVVAVLGQEETVARLNTVGTITAGRQAETEEHVASTMDAEEPGRDER